MHLLRSEPQRRIRHEGKTPCIYITWRLWTVSIKPLYDINYCKKVQCGPILCEFETERYKNINKVSIFGPISKYCDTPQKKKKKPARTTYVFIPMKKLILNYGGHPSHHMQPHCTTVQCWTLVARVLSEWTVLTFVHFTFAFCWSSCSDDFVMWKTYQSSPLRIEHELLASSQFFFLIIAVNKVPKKFNYDHTSRAQTQAWGNVCHRFSYLIVQKHFADSDATWNRKSIARVV
jgi:hypothetical protein